MNLSIITNYNYTALLFLGGMCSIIQKSYPRVDAYLQRFEKYNNLSLERRRYIIKNFIKSLLNKNKIHKIINVDLNKKNFFFHEGLCKYHLF